jgi:hypothetical protein
MRIEIRPTSHPFKTICSQAWLEAEDLLSLEPVLLKGKFCPSGGQGLLLLPCALLIS